MKEIQEILGTVLTVKPCTMGHLSIIVLPYTTSFMISEVVEISTVVTVHVHKFLIYQTAIYIDKHRYQLQKVNTYTRTYM